MALEYCLPRIDLREYLRAYYYFDTEHPTLQPLCAENGNIRIILSGGGIIHTPEGGRSEVTSSFLIGPTMGAYQMEAVAGTRAFGIGISAKGWLALCGLSAEEARDRVINLTCFAGGIASSTINEMQNARNLRDMAVAADRFFERLLRTRASRRRATPYPEALARWLLNPNNLGLDALISDMDISRRQTDRIAKMYFGASPKFLQRKYRALRAADRIRAGERSWLSAAGGGFYDQSHFIKEFKTFIGVTPHQFIGNQAQLITEIQNQRAGALALPLASF